MASLADMVAKLDKLRPQAVTVWQSGDRYQCNIRLPGEDGWHVKFGPTVDDALYNCIEGVMKGGKPTEKNTQAEAARDRIRAAADPDDDDRTPQKRPVKRTITEPPKQGRMRF